MHVLIILFVVFAACYWIWRPKTGLTIRAGTFPCNTIFGTWPDRGLFGIEVVNNSEATYTIVDYWIEDVEGMVVPFYSRDDRPDTKPCAVKPNQNVILFYVVAKSAKIPRLIRPVIKLSTSHIVRGKTQKQ